MKDLEREHILATLREFTGSRKKTVEKLGISERTLRATSCSSTKRRGMTAEPGPTRRWLPSRERTP